MNKTLVTTLVVVGILLILGGGIGAYFYLGTYKTAPAKTSTTSDDGGASMQAEFLDANGNPITIGTAQSFLQTGGNYYKIGFMALTLQVKYTTGNADLTAVRLGTVSSPLSENLVKDTPAISTLAKTQTTLVNFITTKGSCSTTADCDAKETCISNNCWINLSKYESANAGVANPITFSTTIKANLTDAMGAQSTIESSAVSLTYDLRGEACSDGTAYLTCKASPNKPKYCTNTTATGAPTLVDKASICGCELGKHAVGDTCVVDTCSDTASTVWHTCKVSPLTSLIGNPTANQRYCATANSALIEDCRGVDGVAGNGDDCGCATDYNGGTGTCQSSGTCSYPSYTGGISGCIPDCLGKATGVSDGCGGTC